MSQPFRTDALRPSSLPSANLGRRIPHPQSSLGIDGTVLTGALAGADGGSGSGDSSERKKALLEVEYQKWNERIDRDVSGVIGGLKDIISLADITSNPTDLTSTTLPLHLPLRTSSLIRSSTNLRDIAHELKLLLVLGDSNRSVQLRDEECKVVREEVRRGREGIMDLFSTTPTATAKDAARAAEGAADSQWISNEVENQVKDALEPASTTAATVEDGQSVQLRAAEEEKGSSTPIPRSTEIPPEVNMDIDPSPSASTSQPAPAPTSSPAPASTSQTQNDQAYAIADQLANQDEDEDEDDDFEEIS